MINQQSWLRYWTLHKVPITKLDKHFDLDRLSENFFKNGEEGNAIECSQLIHLKLLLSNTLDRLTAQ